MWIWPAWFPFRDWALGHHNLQRSLRRHSQNCRRKTRDCGFWKPDEASVWMRNGQLSQTEKKEGKFGNHQRSKQCTSSKCFLEVSRKKPLASYSVIPKPKLPGDLKEKKLSRSHTCTYTNTLKTWAIGRPLCIMGMGFRNLHFKKWQFWFWWSSRPGQHWPG